MEGMGERGAAQREGSARPPPPGPPRGRTTMFRPSLVSTDTTPAPPQPVSPPPVRAPPPGAGRGLRGDGPQLPARSSRPRAPGGPTHSPPAARARPPPPCPPSAAAAPFAAVWPRSALLVVGGGLWWWALVVVGLKEGRICSYATDQCVEIWIYMSMACLPGGCDRSLRVRSGARAEGGGTPGGRSAAPVARGDRPRCALPHTTLHAACGLGPPPEDGRRRRACGEVARTKPCTRPPRHPGGEAGWTRPVGCRWRPGARAPRGGRRRVSWCCSCCSRRSAGRRRGPRSRS